MSSKKRLEDNNNVPIDDFEDWDDFEDFSLESEEGDGRSPSAAYRAEIKEKTVEHFKNPDNIRKYVGKVLPRQYGELMDDYTSAKDQITEAIGEAKENLRQPLNTLAKLLDKKVPDRFKKTKSWITKLKDATSSSSGYSPESLEEQRRKATTLEIQNIFEQIQEENLSIKQEDREVEKERFARNFAKLHSQENLLGIIAKGSDYHRTYLQNLEIPYRKKSLELQYRTVHTLQDILSLQKQARKDNFHLLDKIRVNTGLPEIQKLRVSEHYKQDIRNKFVQNSMEWAKRASGLSDPNSPIGIMVGNFKKKLEEITQAANMYESLLSPMAEADIDDDFGSKKNKNVKLVGGVTTAALDGLPSLIDKYKKHLAPGHFAKLTFKNKRRIAKIRKLGYEIEGIKHDPINKINQLTDALEDMSYDPGIIKSTLSSNAAAFLRMLTDKTDSSPDISIGQMTSSQLREATQFDHYSRKSLTEVIPGYLARILQEQQIQRTGDESIKPLVYNYQGSYFQTSRRSLENLNKVAKSQSASFVKNHADKLAYPIRNGNFTKEQKQAFIRTVAAYKKTGKSFNIRDLAHASFYKGSPAEKWADDFAQYISKNSFGKEHYNKTTNTFLTTLSAFDQERESTRDFIQYMIDTGQANLLKDQGWLDNEYKNINKQKIVDGILGHTDEFQDIRDELVAKGFRNESKPSIQKAWDEPQRSIIIKALPLHETTLAYQEKHLSLLDQLKETLKEHKELTHTDTLGLKDVISKGLEKAVTNINLIRVRKNTTEGTNPFKGINADTQAFKENINRGSDFVKQAAKKTQEGLKSAADKLNEELIFSIQQKLNRGETLSEEEKALIRNFVKKGIENKTKNLSNKTKFFLGTFPRRYRVAKVKVGKKLKALKDWWDEPSAIGDFFNQLGVDTLDFLSQRSIFGSRSFSEFLESGLPTIGDVYIQGHKTASITRDMFMNNKIFDSENNPIKTLQDLAKVKGDVRDDLGNVILTESQLNQTYLRADGKVFIQQWLNYLTKAGRFSKNWLFRSVKELHSRGLKAALQTLNVSKTLSKGLYDLVLPPKDLYVRGEEKPRLLAFKMEQGLYYNQDGTKIFRPTDIKGTVLDDQGNILYDISIEKEPLVDAEGRPVQTLMSLVTGRIRKNFNDTKKIIQNSINFATRNAKRFGRGFKRFLKHGFTGLMTSPNIPGYDLDPNLDPQTQTNALLFQIRQILDERLYPRATNLDQGSYFKNQPNKNEPPQDQQDDQVPASSSDTLGKLFSLSKTGLTTAAGAIGGLLTKGKSRFGRFFSNREKSLQQETTKEESSREDDIKDIQQLKEEQKNTTKKLFRRFLSKGLFQRDQPKVTKDKEGKPLREGSAEERKANWVNINEPTKTLDDVVMPEQVVRKNTIDAMIDLASKIATGFKDAIGSLLGGGNALDALDGLGDMGGEKKGSKPTKAPNKETRWGGIKRRSSMVGRGVGKLAKGLGAVGGYIGSKAWSLGKRIVKPVGKLLKFGAKQTLTSPGRVSLVGKGLAMAGKYGFMLGKGLFNVGKFALGKVLPKAAGALLGGPVGWAITGYLTYRMLKGMFSKKPAQNNELHLIRMAEYGAPFQDTAVHEIFTNIEELTAKATTFTDDQAKINKADIDFAKIASLTGIAGKEDQIEKFLAWFDHRFTPVFLKWYSVAHYMTSDKLSDLDTLPVKDKLKVLATTENSQGWDFQVNPLGNEALKITSAEIQKVRDSFKEKLERELYSKDNKVKSKDKKELIKEGDSQYFKKMNKDPVSEKENNTNISSEMRLRNNLYKQDQKIQRDRNIATYQTNNLEKLSNDTLTPLQSLRFRLYGFKTMTASAVHSCKGLEKFILPYVKVDQNGKAMFTADTSEIYKKTAYLFGLDPQSKRKEMYFVYWLNKRFIPVFTTFISSSKFHAGSSDDLYIITTASATRVLAIAKTLVATGVIKEFAGPWQYFDINRDPSQIDEILKVLEKQAQEDEVKEDIKKPIELKENKQHDSNNPKNHEDFNVVATKDQAAFSLNKQKQVQEASGFVKVSYKSNQVSSYKTIPSETNTQESETESIKTNQPDGVKDATNYVAPSAIPSAPGDLRDGSSGMQFIKTDKDYNHINGLHPEMRRLFLGMAQEYGEITGRKIQLNRGFVTYQEQVKEKEKNPRKAATPGHSMHEFGLAVDINTVDANALERLGLMKKYGFTRPVGGETWHLEPSGLQHDPHGLKKNPEKAAAAIASSPGTGGGGIGHKLGARLGSRNTQAAIKARQTTGNKVQPEQLSKSEKVNGPGGFASSIEDNVKNNSILTQPKGDREKLYDQLNYDNHSKDSMKQLVEKAAQGVGIQPDAAKITAAMESGFRSSASASTSSAKGLFQFTSGTWNDMMKKHAKTYGIPAGTSPTDPKANAILGSLYMRENLQKAQSRNQDTSLQNAYLYHFAGPTGANAIINASESETLADIMPKAAAANKSLYYNKDGSAKTKEEFMKVINYKIEKAAQGFDIDTSFMDSQTNRKQEQTLNVSKTPTRRVPEPVRENFARSPISQKSAPPSRIEPVVSKAELDFYKVLQDGNKILMDQLGVQKEIKQAVDAVKASIEETLKQTLSEIVKPSGELQQDDQSSHLGRKVQQLSKPAYRTT